MMPVHGFTTHVGAALARPVTLAAAAVALFADILIAALRQEAMPYRQWSHLRSRVGGWRVCGWLAGRRGLRPLGSWPCC